MSVETKQDDLKRACIAGRQAMAEAPIAFNPFDQSYLTVRGFISKLYGTDIADAMITKMATAYDQEVLAYWSAKFDPVPIKALPKHAPLVERLIDVSKNILYPAIRFGFALIGATVVLKTIVQ